MNQRSAFGRNKESRREKIIRCRRDDEEQLSEDETPSRRSSSYARSKETEKARSSSRDTLVFRRQGKAAFSKSGEGSPSRHADSVKGEGRPRGIVRDYTSHRRPGYLDSNHVVDDGRLKSFLHRLLRDEDKERQATLIRQLRTVFQHPENVKVIQANKDDIASTFEDFIQLGLNPELKQELILTVGALGATLGVKAKSLLDWQFTVVSMSKSEDVRILILKSVLEMLKIDAEKKNLSELVPFIMAKLQSALEVADNPDLLIAIVNVISEIARGYPSIFSNNFSDTVDILIGWHIDATQQPHVIEFTSSTLVGFQHFWIADMHFTSTLLGQFLEDMESYAEGLPRVKPHSSVLHLKELAHSKLNSNAESLPSPEENIAKIKSLIRVLITVLKSIGDLVVVKDNGPISPKFVSQMLKGFLKHVKITVEYCYYSDLMTLANDCLVLLLRLCGERAQEAVDPLCAYVGVLQRVQPLLSPQHHLASLLGVMVEVVRAVGTHLPTAFVRQVFDVASATRRLRHSPSLKVQKLLIELYHVVLAVKNVQVVEEFYRCLMVDTMEAHSQLLSSPHSTTCQASFLLSICALVHIGNIKHSLIRIFALKPSYFELMVNQLQPTNPEFSKKFPALQTAILFTLYSHCQRHSHFVSSSTLVGGGSSSLSGHNSPICPPSPSSGHLERVVQLLAHLLHHSAHHSYDTRLLALKWSIEILESMQRHLPCLVQTSPFSELLQATLDSGFSNFNTISKSCCKSLHIFLKSSKSALSDATLQRCYELCVLQLNSHDPDLQEQFASLLALLPLDCILRGPSSHVARDSSLASAANPTLNTWTVSRNQMGRPASGNFFGHHFRSICSFILQGKEPQEKKWLLRLYSSCPPAEKGGSSPQTHPSAPFLWFWATWEVAQACVLNKLRTPLGKPQETFMAIEAALKSAAKPSKNQESFYSEAKHVTLLRHSLLLSLLEYLEKHMYNAFEGCASALPSPPKNVRTFFRTNKSTCLEWVGRVRSTAVGVALSAGCPATAARHGLQLLDELRNTGNAQGPELEGILYNVVKALIQLHCPEAVLGLYFWCKDSLHHKYPWIKASVDCAAGRLESTVTEYQRIYQSLTVVSDTQDNNAKSDGDKQLLSNGVEADSKSGVNGDAHLKSFLLNQVIDCYAKLQNWTEAIKWSELLEKTKFNQNGLSVPSSYNNLAYFRCMNSFEESCASLSKKEASTHVNNLANSDSGQWAMEEQLNKAKRTLLAAAAQMDASTKTRERDEVKEAKSSILKLMKISALSWPLHIDSVQASLFLSTSTFLNKSSPVLFQENIKLDPTDCYSYVLGFLLTWENIWQRLNQGSSNENVQGGLVDLHLVASRLARKQQNLNQCGQLIRGALRYVGADTKAAVNEPLRTRVEETLEWTPTERLVRLQRETAKLLFCLGKKDEASNLLLRSISKVSTHLKNSTDTDQLPELNSRSMLNIVKYILPEHLNSVPFKEVSCLLTTMDQDMKSTLGTQNGLQQEKGLSDADFVTGQMLQLSVRQCPTLAKSWCSYAAWCYSNGRKVVNNACGGSLSILPEEKARLFELLPPSNKEDLGSIVSIVTNLHNSTSGEWDSQEMDWCGADEVRWQLGAFLPSLPLTDEFTDGVVEVWRGIIGRAYSYYSIAASAYFRYLKLHGEGVEQKEDDNVTATLRLLRLVVKHASELRDVLEEGLAETPTAPWRGIIPQLFSRLNHPEMYVRKSISDLLSRVAQDAPHLIVFPAVVGSLALSVHTQLKEEAVAGLLGAYFPDGAEEDKKVLLSSPESEEDEEESVGKGEVDLKKTQVMQNCFSALVETLSAQDQKTISETKVLVHELHRITLLWDELWLGTLGIHQGEVNRRFQNLEKEISKVLNNTHLSKTEKREIIKEKHAVYVKPTLFLLEQLQNITGQPAETPHEHWFQKTFEKLIEETLEKLMHPDDPSRPQESWALFKQLHQHLQQKGGHSRSHLFMSQVSPVLSSLSSTPIPMPGIHSRVVIQAVHNTITVLPTKTKPKKLSFAGSDGRRYTYLFKGLEDLHLDERIMQFLSIVNNMFTKSRRHAEKQVFYARHYSVVPLGPRSGLIQWVDGATPLFGLYKRWQQREASSLSKNSSGNAGSVLRPSEIFYNKLTPLLKEKNVTSLDNRKEWPLSVLLDVLKQLQEETADDLLTKELWCSCVNAQEWWKVSLRYNHSTAVMSIIGYVIGLGDRHLDNVLVDLHTGEVVHIDYNVCFEKGKNLRVPEKVPFRMTPNLRTALGLTGVEGVFRSSCEHVLRVLRKGKETLLTLLEAFVYDPLVDWAPGSEGGYTGAVYGGRRAINGDNQTRQDMEVDIALSMFAIRVVEMKAQWNKNRDDLLQALPHLERLLGEWRVSQLHLQEVETELQEACQEKALLEEALSNPHHTLYTVCKRYEEATIVKTTVNATKDAVNEKLNECKKWHTLHCDALSAVCGSELSKMCDDVSGDQLCLSVAPAVEFLQSAGKGQLVQQCEQAESELAMALQQRRLSMRNCIELLTTYVTIIMQFGPGYKEQNRCFRWKQWLEELMADFSSNRCLAILSAFSSQYGRESADAIQAAISVHLQMQTFLTETNNKVMAIADRMRLEGLDDKNVFVNDANHTVLQYLTECGESSHIAFLCMMGNALCTVQKQLFLLEKTVEESYNQLPELRNGDWILDEVSSTCGNAAQHVQLVLDSPLAVSRELKQALLGMKSAHFVFIALEDLHLHFQNIILPEALQSALEPSVLEMVSRLDRIIARTGHPLDRLLQDLHAHMHDSMKEHPPVTDNRISDTVKKLRNEFESLMQRSEPNIAGLNQGQMLLMGLNGLFTKVDSDVEALLSYLDHLSFLHPFWHKMDFYPDTIALAPPLHHPTARCVLRDIYFVRKLQVMQQTFRHCHTIVSSLHPPHQPLMDSPDALLLQPIRHFVADYVRHMLLGLPSQALSLVLCQLTRDLAGDLPLDEEGVPSEKLFVEAAQGCHAQHLLPPLSALLVAAEAAWRKEDLHRRLEQHLLMARCSHQRAQLQLARFQWLNEDLLLVGNAVQNATVSSRASIMSEIRKSVSGVVSLECVVSAAQERYLALVSGVEQRLKWAAGANPSLQRTQADLEESIAQRMLLCSNASKMSQELVSMCNSILHFEALRTRTSEAVSSDTLFLALVNRCKETCELPESCRSQVSSTEEHLILLKPLCSAGVSPEWLMSVMQCVSQSLTTCREKLEQHKSSTNACRETLHCHVAHMHELISVHHKLMSEVRHILRNLAKHEEQELGSEGPVHQYTSAYRDFSERLSSLMGRLLKEEVGDAASLEGHIPKLGAMATDIYERLVDLAGPLGRTEGPKGEVVRKLPLLDTKVTRCATPKKVTRDPKTGKAVQERNTYATNIWKRIKMKLEGKDPDPSRKASVSEQVDFVIREATLPENLAVLYEGWTPWV